MSKIARIIDRIWLGRADYDPDELRVHNIHEVIVVAKEIELRGDYYGPVNYEMMADVGASFTKFDVEDDKEIDEMTLYQIFNAISTTAIEKHKRVLIHCQGGMSRSPAIIIGYFMYMGMSYSEALAFVQWRLGEKWPIFPASRTMDSIRKYFKEI